MENKDKIIFYKSVYYFIIIANILYFLIYIMFRNPFWDYILGLDFSYGNIFEEDTYKYLLSGRKFQTIFNIAHFSVTFYTVTLSILTLLKIIFLKNNFNSSMNFLFYISLFFTLLLILIFI